MGGSTRRRTSHEIGLLPTRSLRGAYAETGCVESKTGLTTHPAKHHAFQQVATKTSRQKACNPARKRGLFLCPSLCTFPSLLVSFFQWANCQVEPPRSLREKLPRQLSKSGYASLHACSKMPTRGLICPLSFCPFTTKKQKTCGVPFNNPKKVVAAFGAGPPPLRRKRRALRCTERVGKAKAQRKLAFLQPPPFLPSRLQKSQRRLPARAVPSQQNAQVVHGPCGFQLHLGSPT